MMNMQLLYDKSTGFTQDSKLELLKPLKEFCQRYLPTDNQLDFLLSHFEDKHFFTIKKVKLPNSPSSSCTIYDYELTSLSSFSFFKDETTFYVFQLPIQEENLYSCSWFHQDVGIEKVVSYSSNSRFLENLSFKLKLAKPKNYERNELPSLFYQIRDDLNNPYLPLNPYATSSLLESEDDTYSDNSDNSNSLYILVNEKGNKFFCFTLKEPFYNCLYFEF